ncbi:vWA domain-containing protein [Thermomonospora catenispora]|uniref:vWA domain-containing protein n=1 Tax=Thermomonospora catenispora TaxID=2493090 RepID=UPI0011243EA1|nr:VWA domain-containing protein [Thermomonospora catenispora]TNY38172.1 VWA domain-containing protein [Thermomonospora catenispora]
MSQQVLPFYLVCDESYSMDGAPIDAINKSLPEIHQEIGGNPVVADKTRFCLISFSSTAQVLLPLSDLSEVTSMPAMAASGSTSYTAAFTLLRDTIERDVAALKAAGHQVLRPAVFFLTDGQPTDDDWVSAYQRLTDPSWKPRPNILAFGFGGVNVDTIQQVATVRGFLADGSLGPAQALQEFAQSLIQSVINSGTSADAGGGMSLAMPDKVPGFTTVPADPV